MAQQLIVTGPSPQKNQTSLFKLRLSTFWKFAQHPQTRFGNNAKPMQIHLLVKEKLKFNLAHTKT